MNTKENLFHKFDSRRKTKDRLPGCFIKTYGCQMNVYDTDKLYKLLESSYRSVDSPEEAELIIVNTCSVREKPEHKLYSLLGRFKELKKNKPSLLIGVGGCVAQQAGEAIIKRSSVVDFVFGTHNLSLVPSLIKQRIDSEEPQLAVDYREDWEDLPLGPSQDNRVSTFVTISRGCNKACAYCIVPTTRGPEVSRHQDEIIREVKLAVRRGSKEIVLLGQNVNSYGGDLRPKVSFAELLKLVSNVSGVERIRFTSPHPQDIKDDFYELFATDSKLCRHVHMPLQSGSNRILKAMRRNYHQRRYLEIINKLKQYAPDVAITTDIIVGFPGETREDFEDTLSVVREVAFDSSFSFVFSPRPGTEAAKLENQVSREEAESRLNELQELQAGLQAQSLQNWVGKEVEVLIEGESKGDSHSMQGRISQNHLVNLLPAEQEVVAGSTVCVKVIEARRHTLLGELVKVLS
jgi:tRNA-2-methylthio-N6-dimethylallyladenosine synthase